MILSPLVSITDQMVKTLRHTERDEQWQSLREENLCLSIFNILHKTLYAAHEYLIDLLFTSIPNILSAPM